MAYGFNDDRSKVEVYSTDEVYTKEETYSKEQVDNKEHEELVIKAMHGSGSLRLIFYKDIIIAIDTGLSTDDVSGFLVGELGDKKIDVLVFTHMHYDHVTGINSVVPYVKDDALVVMGMDPTSDNDEYSSHNTNKNTVLGFFPNIIVPSENQVFEYGDLSIRFNNLTLSNRSVYDSCKANNGDYDDGKSGINNYSLITTVKTPFATYVDTGDIEGEAQRLNEQYMESADVVLLPHHNANAWGYLPFFKKLNPKCFCVTSRATSTSKPSEYLYSECYNALLLEYFKNFIVGNNSNIFDISITKQGNIHVNFGDIFHNTSNEMFLEPILYMCLNPSWYPPDGDPYIFYKMSLYEFLKTYKDQNLIQASHLTYTSRSKDQGFSIHEKALELLGISSGTLRWEFLSGYCRIYQAGYLVQKSVEIHLSGINSDYTKGIRTREDSGISVSLSLDTPQSGTYTVTDTETKKKIASAQILYVKVRTSVDFYIGALKTSEQESGVYRGLLLDRNCTTLYHVYYNNGLIEAKKILLSDMSVSDLDIIGLRTV